MSFAGMVDSEQSYLADQRKKVGLTQDLEDAMDQEEGGEKVLSQPAVVDEKERQDGEDDDVSGPVQSGK